jgi:hypothetical protein
MPTKKKGYYPARFEKYGGNAYREYSIEQNAKQCVRDRKNRLKLAAVPAVAAMALTTEEHNNELQQILKDSRDALAVAEGELASIMLAHQQKVRLCTNAEYHHNMLLQDQEHKQQIESAAGRAKEAARDSAREVRQTLAHAKPNLQRQS